MYRDLNDFLSALDAQGLLARVRDEVNPDLEMCAVTDRACKSTGGGPALLFERPTGHSIRWPRTCSDRWNGCVWPWASDPSMTWPTRLQN